MPYGWLQASARRCAQKPALVRAGRAVTFGELARATRALMGVLGRLGVRPGDCLAVQMPETFEYVAALCAADGVGAPLLPLDPALKPNEVDAYCAHGGVEVVLLGAEAPADHGGTGPSREATPPFDELLRMPPARRRSPLDPERYVSLMMSSGTTGRPKIVPRTRAQLHAQRRVVDSRLELCGDDRLLATLPLFHAAGLFSILMAALEHGATLHLEPRTPRALAAAVERECVTAFLGTPFIHRALVETHFARPVRFGSLRFATSSTSALPPSVAREFRRKFGLPLRAMYGSTEAGSMVVGPPMAAQSEPGWLGPPLDEVTVQIRDDEGRAMPPAGEGQIVVRSPAAASCYLNDPEATAATFRDGRVLTGDLGLMTPEGDLRLIGRMKDVISVAGKKVSPAEVEAALGEHPQVAEALVLPGQGEEGQEVVSAYVVATGKVTPGQLRAFCGQRLAAFKVPRQVTFVPALPRSATGKVLRRVPPASPGCE